MARNRQPKAFGSIMAARGLTTGRVNAPRSAEVGSFSARAVAMAYRKMAPTVERGFPCCFVSAACLDGPQDFQNLRGGNRPNVKLAQRRHDERQIPVDLLKRTSRPAFTCQLGSVLISDLFEGVGHGRKSGLPRVGLRQAWIFAGNQPSPGRVTRVAGFLQSYERVGAKRQQLSPCRRTGTSAAKACRPAV